MTPKVSIIVLTYNQEKLIGRTLDSILAQQCDFPFEIIVGEDCSTDGTLDVCRSYAERYPDIIRLFANKPNKGLVDNYYDCILEAKGEYIADCGGDDFWVDRFKLQKEADVLDGDPEITIVHTGWQYYDEPTGTVRPSGSEIHHHNYLKPVSEKGELFLPILSDTHGPLIHLCTAMFRRNALMKCYNADTRLFRDKQFPCEDFQIVTSLARDGKVAYLPEVTLSYSVGKPSIMSLENLEKNYRFYIASIKLLHYIMIKNGISPDKLATQYSNRLHFTLTQAFRLYNRDMREEVLAWYEKTGAPQNMKTRLLRLLSSNRVTWRLALRLLNKIKPYRHE